MNNNVIELRHWPRTPTLLRGKIHFINKLSVLDCTVREVSNGGARLEVPSTVGVPEIFILKVPSLNIDHRCHVAWATGREIGVAFD